MKTLKMKKLYHVTPIENRISIMKYGLIDDVRDMGVYFSDDDDSSVKWIMKRTEGKNGFLPKQLLLCTVEFDENDPKLFRSLKGKDIEENLIECKSYFYQNHIPPQNIFFELVEIENEDDWDYYEIDSTEKTEFVTPNFIRNYYEKYPRKSLGMGYSNGKCFPIKINKKLYNDNDFKLYYESGLNRKIGMINHGYLKDELTEKDNVRFTKYYTKVYPIMSVLGMVG